MELCCECEEDFIDYKYIYCVNYEGLKQYYLTEPETRYIHNKGGLVNVIRCREGDLVYVKARINSGERFHW